MNEVSFANIDKAVTDRIAERMVQLRDDIRNNINILGLRASGRTQQSLQVEVTSNEVSLWGRKFFSAMEYGTQPWSGYTGIRCTIQAFKDIIRQWASDKGLNFGQAREHERAISAITMTIIRKGSRLYRNSGYINVYDTLIAEAIKDIGNIALDETGTQFDIAVNQWARMSTNITI